MGESSCTTTARDEPAPHPQLRPRSKHVGVTEGRFPCVCLFDSTLTWLAGLLVSRVVLPHDEGLVGGEGDLPVV